MENEFIRNFCIVAHIDHGKSTLADRILEMTGTIEKRNMQEQILDSMDLERERGITIKAKAVRIKYKAEDGNNYTLNLIDTPGHVDFSYEVSRSLASCEGAILLADASQGVEAQTIANANLAIQHGLKIIPVINKVDLTNAQIERTRSQLLQLLSTGNRQPETDDDIILASAKTGQSIKEILESIVKKIQPPKGSSKNPLACLIFDSAFSSYEGVIVYVRVMEGAVKKGEKIKLIFTGKTYEVIKVGVFEPGKMIETDVLSSGEVGFIIANIKNIRDIQIGDTVTHPDKPTDKPLPGYKKVKPMVFASIYPVSSSDFEMLKRSMEKLSLNDASFTYAVEDSPALGPGFRCGFLGLLHMDIVKERLEREYDLELILTMPSVIYRVVTHDGPIEIDSPSRMPEPGSIIGIEEPYVKVMIIAPVKYVSGIMDMVLKRKRGVFKDTKYMDETQVYLDYEMPLSEMILDFYDQLKSISSGYASLDYDLLDYRQNDLVKIDVLVAGEKVDALSFIVHRNNAEHRGRELAKQLKELISRHLFEVAIQIAVGGKIIARESIPALRKTVTAKCYGGDITRKRKLWEKQKEGKKRMKMIGRVEIPQEAFLSILKI
jgi:GTP-binding protein LepA